MIANVQAPVGDVDSGVQHRRKPNPSDRVLIRPWLWSFNRTADATCKSEVIFPLFATAVGINFIAARPLIRAVPVVVVLRHKSFMVCSFNAETDPLLLSSSPGSGARPGMVALSGLFIAATDR